MHDTKHANPHGVSCDNDNDNGNGNGNGSFHCFKRLNANGQINGLKMCVFKLTSTVRYEKKL